MIDHRSTPCQPSVATFALIDIFLNPSKKEVSYSEAQDHCQTEPIIEVHKDQHQQIGYSDLQQIEAGLYKVGSR